MNYQEAEALFSRAKNKKAGKPVANNTRLMRRQSHIGPRGYDGILRTDYAIRLHDTDVVTIHPDDTYTLRTGGRETVTTKQRINEFSPAQVYSTRKVWMVGGSLFTSGMKVGAGGAPFEHNDPTAKLALQQELDKKVRKYINGYMKHIADGNLKDPSGGCCWLCIMGPGGGGDHLISHMDEKYYVPRLLLNALMLRGGNVGFLWSLCKAGKPEFAKHALQAYFRKYRSQMIEHMEGK